MLTQPLLIKKTLTKAYEITAIVILKNRSIISEFMEAILKLRNFWLKLTPYRNKISWKQYNAFGR